MQRRPFGTAPAQQDPSSGPAKGWNRRPTYASAPSRRPTRARFGGLVPTSVPAVYTVCVITPYPFVSELKTPELRVPFSQGDSHQLK